MGWEPAYSLPARLMEGVERLCLGLCLSSCVVRTLMRGGVGHRRAPHREGTGPSLLCLFRD